MVLRYVIFYSFLLFFIIQIIEIYQLLQSITSTIDCYYIYAIVLVRQFTDEKEIKPLLDLFALVKSKEIMEAVATKFVTLLKNFLEPSKLKVKSLEIN